MSVDSTSTATGTNVTATTKETMDINTSLKLTSMLLNGKNYQAWAKAARISLKGKGKLGYINGTRPRPVAITEAEEWEVQDSIILSWLLHSMEPNISEEFVHRAETAQEMWDNLKKRYGKQDNFAHIFQIKQEIVQNKQGQKSFAQLYSEMQRKWDELDILQPETSDPEQIRQRKDQERVFQLLANLDSSFEQTRSQILLSTDLPSLEKVAAIIEQEETRRTVMRGPQVRADEEHDSHALIARHQRNPNFKGKNITQAKCAHCKQLGHKQEMCWFLHPELRPGGWIDKGDGGRKGEKDVWRGKRGDSFAKREESRIFSTEKIFDPVLNKMDRPISAPRDGSTGSAGSDPVQQMFQEFSMWYSKKNCDGISLNSFSDLNNQIVLDSGATDHMFCNKNS
jgi:gag-polypeptide of LTR copia-type